MRKKLLIFQLWKPKKQFENQKKKTHVKYSEKKIEPTLFVEVAKS